MVADSTELTAKVGRRSYTEVARSEWLALGRLGRTVFVALAVSGAVASALAVTIPRQIEQSLVEGEIRTITRISNELAGEGLIPPNTTDPASMAALDRLVRVNLLGSDVVRVKVWSPEGVVTYSDVPELIGSQYALSEDRLDAFQGVSIVEMADPSRPENVYETDLPPLREFYVPVHDEERGVIALFEVYHLAGHIDAIVGEIRGYIWLSFGAAAGLLGAFITVLIVANGRVLVRRRQLTERLFADLVRSQADERARVIGSLHDDIGQTLYRVHFGLEDLKSRVDGGDPSVAVDLDHLGSLVNDIDGSLRAELRLLQYGTGEELALGGALEELAEVTEMESDLQVSVVVDTEAEVTPSGRVALFRAAREAVTNVRKHAGAETVLLHVYRKGRTLRLRVTDDGAGISDAEGLGLTTTRERLEALGGGL
jgi:signal transduction histidine kinase